MKDEPNKGFKISTFSEEKDCGCKGFCMKFHNDVTVSIQFGHGNYCENRDFNLSSWDKEPGNCANAEVAAWIGERGDWVTMKVAEVAGLDAGDDVIGWLSPDEVARFIEAASKLTT